MALGDRPTVDPQWAYDVAGDAEAADVTTPSSGKKAAGFASGEKPAAQIVNWIWTKIFQWIIYLKTVTWEYDIFAPAKGWTVNTVVAPRVFDVQGAVGSSTAGATQIAVDISGSRGNKITEVRLSTLEDNTAAMTFKLYELTGSAGTLNQIGDTITSGTSAGAVEHFWDDSTNDSVNEVPYTVATGNRLILLIDLPQTSANDECIVYKVTVRRD